MFENNKPKYIIHYNLNIKNIKLNKKSKIETMTSSKVFLINELVIFISLLSFSFG